LPCSRSATTTAPSRTPGHPQQGVLDLADLDPEAADLDLGIPAAEELQLALRQPAAVIPAPVKPLALPVRIGQERPPGALRVIDVAAPDTHPGEDDLTRGAQRHRRQVLIDTYTRTFCTAGPSGTRSPSGARSITSWLVSSEVSVNP